MQDEEDLAHFIEEQRAKIAHDRNILKNNPASAITDNSINRQYLKMNKENRLPPGSNEIPSSVLTNGPANPTMLSHTRPPSTPRIFRLGDDYKRKREKLKEELREDYRHAMAEKNLRTTGVRSSYKDVESGIQNSVTTRKNSNLGLSLPIRDHPSAKVKDAATETYEELLTRKRKQEKSYRAANDDQEDFRERSRFHHDDRDEDDGYYSQRKVRFPSKGRRPLPRSRRHRDYYEEDDSDEPLYRSRSRRRRGRGRRRGRTSSSDEDDEADDYSEEGDRRRRRDVSTEKKKLTSSFEREATTGSLYEKREKNDVNDLRSKSAPPDQENTGLPIGHVASANTVQRRKQEYGAELRRQMEEKKLSKKKERELDLQMDATLASNADLKTTRNSKVEDSPLKRSTAASPPRTEEKKSKKKGKRSLKYKLESSSDEEEEPRRSILRQNYAGPRYPGPAPQGYYPPQYPTPYDEAYYYYGTRNPLDPPGMAPQGPPVGMYQAGLSPMMAAAMSNRESTNGERKHGEDGLTNLNSRRPIDKNESSLIADEKRDEGKKQQLMRQYQEELKIQIAHKEREKQLAKAEQEQYERKIEDEARNYNPWGKGGGGAPMKDRQGNLISDLRQMHLENEEVVRDPTKAEEVVKERLPQTNLYRREDRPVIDLSPRQGGAEDPNVTSPRFGFGRSNPFEMKQSNEQKEQRDQYKDYLEKQIEEKRKIEAEKREKERIEEEKEERRLEEQRKKIQAELDAELQKERNKIEMAQRQNEQMRNQAQERKQEEKRKKQEEREQHDDEARRKREEELNERLRANNPSPPVPALQTQDVGPQTHRLPPDQPRSSLENGRVRNQPPAPIQVSHTPQILTYRAGSPAQVEDRNKIRSRAESKRISRELSALRKQLLSEQRRVEDQLRTVDAPIRRANTEYLVDLSKTRQKPVAVRRPPTVEKDRPNSRALKEFNDYKYRPDDTASIRMFRAEYPETPSDARTLERQQEALLARQGKNLESMRQGKNDSRRDRRGRKEKEDARLFAPQTAQSRTSMLEAETSYIPVYAGSDDEDDVDMGLRFHSNESSEPPSRGSRRTSARERRRLAQKPPSVQSDRSIPPRARPDNFSLNSLNSLATLDVDRLAKKNQDRLDKLRAIQGDDVSLTDPDDILDRFVHKHKGGDGKRLGRRPGTNEDGVGGRAGPSGFRDPGGVDLDLPTFNTRPPSVNTVDTEPWLRPETGQTVS